MTTRIRAKRNSQLVQKVNRDLHNEFSDSDTENDFNNDNIEKMDVSPAVKIGTKRKERRSKQKAVQKVLDEFSDSDTENDFNNDNVKKMDVSPTGTKRRTRTLKQIAKMKLPTSSEDSETSEDSDEIIDKPSDILIEQDVAGKSMFGFKKNQKRGGFAQRISKIKNNQNTPSSKKQTETNEATPYTLRNKARQNFAKLLKDSDEDFSASESDFKPSGGSSSSSSEQENSDADNNANSAAESSDEEIFRPVTLPKQKLKNPTNTTSKSYNNDQTYIMKSEDYFSWQATSKIVTSNHTLQKLKQPKLSEDELQELLMASNLNQSSVHEKLIHDMFKSNCSNFNKWIYIIHEGFNILLYGLGSKRNILHTFQKEMLNSSPVIVVNGYFPSLTIKDVTDSIINDIFEDSSSPGNVYEAVELIGQYCRQSKHINLYIIVHNIDGPMLRNNKSQNVLALLAELPNVHLLASIDHINTPLIWDHSKLSKFNFTWWDVTSFLPYSDETSFESSMLVQRSGALALSSLSNVYQSLTKNSKGIFMLIVKYQMKNKAVKYYQGMPFKELYSQCRENFLVSSDLALRTQLTEFLDHKLVKSKRAVDGVEHLTIPINNSLLQQFLEQTS